MKNDSIASFYSGSYSRHTARPQPGYKPKQQKTKITLIVIFFLSAVISAVATAIYIVSSHNSPYKPKSVGKFGFDVGITNVTTITQVLSIPFPTEVIPLIEDPDPDWTEGRTFTWILATVETSIPTDPIFDLIFTATPLPPQTVTTVEPLPSSAPNTTPLTPQTPQNPACGIDVDWCAHFNQNGLNKTPDQIFKELSGVNSYSRMAPFRSIVQDPLNSENYVLKIHFSKGSYTTHHDPHGGTVMYLSPPSFDWAGAKSVRFCYDVLFPLDFEFQLGGKMPGLFGGSPFGCSNPPNCFATRPMWRKDGSGEFYPTLDQKLQSQGYCKTPPRSTCGTGVNGFGDSIGTGSFEYTRGVYNNFCQDIDLNDVGTANGAARLYLDGVLKLEVTNMVWRTSASVGFNGIAFHTFFGGNDPKFASPKDQDVYFNNLSLKKFK